MHNADLCSSVSVATISTVFNADPRAELADMVLSHKWKKVWPDLLPQFVSHFINKHNTYNDVNFEPTRFVIILRYLFQKLVPLFLLLVFKTSVFLLV